MGTLTKKERDALEDVFLSIQTPQHTLQKYTDFTTFFSLSTHYLSSPNYLKQVLKRVKEGKKSTFFTNYLKKKKNLSK